MICSQIPALKSFPCLQKEYKLTSRELRTYLCISYCMLSLPNWPCKIPSSAWVHLNAPATILKGISLFYTIFQQKTTFVKKADHYKQCENDLGTTYTDKQWLRANKMTYRVTLCSTLWELSQKITLRWYLTPDKLLCFRDQSSNLCWRVWGKRGAFYTHFGVVQNFLVLPFFFLPYLQRHSYPYISLQA